jgi:hypothetical protein
MFNTQKKEKYFFKRFFLLLLMITKSINNIIENKLDNNIKKIINGTKKPFIPFIHKESVFIFKRNDNTNKECEIINSYFLETYFLNFNIIPKKNYFTNIINWDFFLELEDNIKDFNLSIFEKKIGKPLVEINEKNQLLSFDKIEKFYCINVEENNDNIRTLTPLFLRLSFGVEKKLENIKLIYRPSETLYDKKLSKNKISILKDIKNVGKEHINPEILLESLGEPMYTQVTPRTIMYYYFDYHICSKNHKNNGKFWIYVFIYDTISLKLLKIFSEEDFCNDCFQSDIHKEDFLLYMKYKINLFNRYFNKKKNKKSFKDSIVFLKKLNKKIKQKI